MEIIPLGPGFAAELRGITLAEVAADDAAYQETRAAFEEHSVIVFRGQEVTDEVQLAFSRRFGPIEVTGGVVSTAHGVRSRAETSAPASAKSWTAKPLPQPTSSTRLPRSASNSTNRENGLPSGPAVNRSTR